MIPKASQRGGGQQLATHLLNEYDNDRVEVAHVRGAIAQDLHGAFAEWRAVSRATQCQKYLYSLSLNPDPRQGPLTRTQYFDFIARAEKTLGLDEQPRAVVFHVKYGREHCHVVWSRIDGQKMKAVQLSHDHQQLRGVARDFARDHKLQLPDGMKQDQGRERYRDRQKRENLHEQQQQERSGITKAERVAVLTAAWNETRTAAQLATALEQRGYLLARGAQRSYVVVDTAGEIHSLARQIEGAKTKDVNARLADGSVGSLPDAQEAQAFFRDKHAAQQEQERKAAREAPERAPEQMSPRARRDALAARQLMRRQVLLEKKEAAARQHAVETKALKEAQALERSGVEQARLTARPGPVMAFLMRITGIGKLVEGRHRRQDAQRAQTHKEQRDALTRRHGREMTDLRHREHALSSVEMRERVSAHVEARKSGRTSA